MDSCNKSQQPNLKVAAEKCFAFSPFFSSSKFISKFSSCSSPIPRSRLNNIVHVVSSFICYFKIYILIFKSQQPYLKVRAEQYFACHFIYLLFEYGAHVISFI